MVRLWDTSGSDHYFVTSGGRSGESVYPRSLGDHYPGASAKSHRTIPPAGNRQQYYVVSLRILTSDTIADPGRDCQKEILSTGTEHRGLKFPSDDKGS